MASRTILEVYDEYVPSAGIAPPSRQANGNWTFMYQHRTIAGNEVDLTDPLSMSLARTHEDELQAGMVMARYVENGQERYHVVFEDGPGEVWDRAAVSTASYLFDNTEDISSVVVVIEN